MKTAKFATMLGAVALLCAALPAASFGQAQRGQYVADFGAAFTQATVVKAQTGLAGIDIQVGKMITGGLSVGLATGYDVCSFRTITYDSGSKVYERMGVVPILAKARYNLNVAPLTVVHASVAAGVYQTIPHLDTTPIGGIWESGTHAGGAAAIGGTYYFMGTMGVGAEFEYNFFDSGAEELFSYFALRLNFSMIKM